MTKQPRLKTDLVESGIWLVYNEGEGFVQTLLVPLHKLPKKFSAAADLAAFYRILLKRLKKKFKDGFMVPPDKVAEEAVYVLAELISEEEVGEYELTLAKIRSWVIDTAWNLADMWEEMNGADIPEELAKKLDDVGMAITSLDAVLNK